MRWPDDSLFPGPGPDPRRLLFLFSLLTALAGVGVVLLRASSPAESPPHGAEPPPSGEPAHSMELANAPESEIPPDVFAAAEARIRAEMERGAFPGAALALGTRGQVRYTAGVGDIGWTRNAPPVSPDSTLYDLASLSKVVGTTSAVMLLVEDGAMRLDDPVQRYLPGFTEDGRERVTIRHLLSHTSGLPAGTLLRGGTPGEVVRNLLGTRIYGPPGSHTEYSDIGFVLLWEAAERAAGEPLPEFLERRLFRPLEMGSTRYQPGLDCEACAPTGRLRDHSLYRGKPFDATARKLGGVTGSAGLFSTAHDMGRFAAMIANGGELNGVRVLREETVRAFSRPQPQARDRALGWELFCPRENPQRGNPPHAETCPYGHTGYTGTSLWIDPETGRWVVLLSNRTYEPRAPSRIQELRRGVFDVVTERAPRPPS